MMIVGLCFRVAVSFGRLNLQEQTRLHREQSCSPADRHRVTLPVAVSFVRSEYVAPSGLRVIPIGHQGLTPLATICRPFGAKSRAPFRGGDRLRAGKLVRRRGRASPSPRRGEGGERSLSKTDTASRVRGLS